MSVVVDASPMLINRTAMHAVTRDVLSTLGDAVDGVRCFGVSLSRLPSPEAAEGLRGRLAELLGQAEPAALRAWIRAHEMNVAGRTPARILFLDPLYTLFGELRDDDLVMMLDLSPVTTPGWHNPQVSRLYETAFDRIAAIQPRLIAISHNTAETYIANYGQPRRDIDVLHLYTAESDCSFSEDESRIYTRKPFFLFVGSLEARKNIAGSIAAFIRSGLAARGYQLLIAGGDGHGADEVRRLAQRHESVTLLGWVDSDQLRSLYRSATGFIYPSYVEGFGVPLLEAMHYGAPAVASFTGACPEVGGDMVPYCDPDDHEALAAALVRIAGMTRDQRDDWAAKARARVEQEFGYPRFQRRLREVVLGAG